jgi:hypothetical protein
MIEPTTRVQAERGHLPKAGERYRHAPPSYGHCARSDLTGNFEQRILALDAT